MLAWVIDPERSSALLVRHPRFRRWLPPGGRVEAGESTVDAAARELREETGIVARPVGGPALVDVVDSPLADGTPASTFGVTYWFVVERTSPCGPKPASRRAGGPSTRRRRTWRGSTGTGWSATSAGPMRAPLPGDLRRNGPTGTRRSPFRQTRGVHGSRPVTLLPGEHCARSPTASSPSARPPTAIGSA
ncbi:MAG: NUDIX domain-containing protein [Acidimicrobiia bacterium]